ncbi:MAG: L-threonine 3-dehydrogenase [Ignavibacteriales bacterium]|nr:MAG: L-threonine 3-dehydrogenase [Ignavibacteriales bacterium]
MKKILVVGALGQIGSELLIALREKYGADNVIATDIRFRNKEDEGDGPFEIVDCTDIRSLSEVVKKYQIDTIFHLAAILSAAAEEKPQFAWNLNMNGLYNVLEISREHKCSVFVPSSIAAFGPNTPQDFTPQDTIQRPTTIYGISKVSGELLCDYFHKRFGVDTRGVRFPGIISNKTLPGGGTTDYAVEIYYEAIKHKKYFCYLGPNTQLDMMYMPDAVKASIDLMEADPSKLKHRNAFNITAMSINPEDLANVIKKYIPTFQIQYRVDPMKQRIADSWPNSLDDSAAKEEWGWKPDYDLETMTKDMFEKLAVKLGVEL